MTCAPVLIITLNRCEKFKNCVESLKMNLLADHTDLFIALDFPAASDQIEGYNKTIEFLKTLSGFKSINIIKRERNFGIVQNYLSAKELLFRTYDRVIFSEDDNVFSSDFLNFMNKCLVQYEKNKSIFTISGFNYPVQISKDYSEPVYKWMGHSAWGFGIWKDRWVQIDWNPDVIFDDVTKFLRDISDVYRFQEVANHYLPAMLNMVINKKISGDGYICLHQFRNNLYSIFPTISRVRNYGHDGTGRSKSLIINSPYCSHELYAGSHEYDLSTSIESNININLVLKDFFKQSAKIRLKNFLKLFLFNLKLKYWLS